MKISIGILAKNEEKNIERTLKSIFKQSVFVEAKNVLNGSEWEVVVVANGCNDNTAKKAQKTLQTLCNQLGSLQKNVSWKIFEINEAGKSNAWNHYIHEYSADRAEIIIMIDADIEFNHSDTIYNSVKELQKNPNVDVAVDTPLKHFSLKTKKSLLEKISSLKSSDMLEGHPGIAGSFYCARAEVLRKIWMPIGLTGEDGFLRAMIITDLFRSTPNPSKISRVSNASHFYEGLTTFREIFRHELRMIIGTTLNCYFCWDFLLFATDPAGPGAGYLIKSQLDRNPEWYKEFIKNEVRNRGFWVLPKGLIISKILGMKNCTPRQMPKKILVNMAHILLDFPVFIFANHKIKKGAIGHW